MTREEDLATFSALVRKMTPAQLEMLVDRMSEAGLFPPPDEGPVMQRGGSVPDDRILFPIQGDANTWTWEEHMEWATSGLPEADRAAHWAKYGGIRAERGARDVTQVLG